MASQPNAYVLGVGLTPFIKPRALRQYPELGLEACVKALVDAQINYDDVNAGVACYCYGDTTSGQRIFYQLGMTGIPIYNTNNACATGSTGLHLARQMVKGGLADVVLVCGFEQMQAGSIKSVWGDRPSPMGLSTDLMEETYGKHGKWRFFLSCLVGLFMLTPIREPEECTVLRQCGEGVYGEVSFVLFVGCPFCFLDGEFLGRWRVERLRSWGLTWPSLGRD